MRIANDVLLKRGEEYCERESDDSKGQLTQVRRMIMGNRTQR